MNYPTRSLEIVGRLSAGDYERYLRAGYWLLYSKSAWQLSKSASFTALVNAIEALLPEPAPPTPCEVCERDTNPGPTAQFREFLDKLLPKGSVSPAAKSEFYRIRSKLAHGDRLFYEDMIGLGFNVTSINEDNRLRHLSKIVQIAIYNWLQTRLS